jgi:hypothetical protein
MIDIINAQNNMGVKQIFPLVIPQKVKSYYSFTQSSKKYFIDFNQ